MLPNSMIPVSPRVLGPRPAAARLLGSWVRFLLKAGCSSLVFVMCCEVSDLCDKMITRSEDSRRFYGLSVATQKKNTEFHQNFSSLSLNILRKYNLFLLPLGCL